MFPTTNSPMDKGAVVRPRPTKPAGVALIVAGIVFLPFILLPLNNMSDDGGAFTGMFAVVWGLVCLSFMGYGVYILASNKPDVGIVYDIESKSPSTESAPGGDFDSRLRKLEKLKEDHLITDAEYQQKRAEILKAPW